MLLESDRETLESLRLLGGLGSEGMRELTEDAAVRRYAGGEVVIAQHAEACSFFIVLDGALDVVLEDGAHEAMLGTLQTGDWFGEEALLRGGPRSATVRAREPSRCLEIPRDRFERDLAANVNAHRRLAQEAELRRTERSLRSLAFFVDLDPDEEIEGALRRVSFAAGEMVTRAGDPSTCVWFVLDGVALALGDDGTERRELSRLGPGQCFGELGVIRNEPRAATVMAESHLELLEVSAERFRQWLDDNQELSLHVQSLEHVYRLADGKMLSVYRGEDEGQPCSVTVMGDPSGDGVRTRKRLGADVLVLEPCRQPRGPLASVRFERDGLARTLELAAVERGQRGNVRAGRLARIVVEGTGPDVGQLYRRLLEGGQVRARDLSRFRRSGHLGGSQRADERPLVCQCLQLGASELRIAPDVATVQRATGAGLICGGCVPALEALLREPSLEVDGLQGRTEPSRTTTNPVVKLLDGQATVPFVRPRRFDFDAAALDAIRAVPELHLLVATSMLSTPAEQLIIATLGEAAPQLTGTPLAAAVDAFLEQESNHIVAHRPFNELVRRRLYPRCARLQRLGDEMLQRYAQHPLKERLAISAAYEYASDCIFGSYFSRFYSTDRRYHRHPPVHDAMIASGVADLFAWHALEELSHRHVAFEVARALGVGEQELHLGMRRVVAELARLQFPAFIELMAREGTSPVTFGYAVFVHPGVVRTFLASLLRWFQPNFDPGAEEYDFMSALEADVDKSTEAPPVTDTDADAAAYRFVTNWVIRAPAADVFTVLRAGDRYAEWWPGTLSSGSDGNDGFRYQMRGRFPPYVLDFRARVVEQAAPTRLVVDATGDLEGRGEWTLVEDGDVTRVTYVWTVEVHQPFVRRMSPVLRPLFVANHEAIMDEGRLGLETALRERRGADAPRAETITQRGTMHDLAFWHWAVDPETVQAHLPPGFEVDTFEGQAWVSVVALRITGWRPRALPSVLALPALQELNLRTYVRHGGRSGVFFRSIDLDRRLPVHLFRRQGFPAHRAHFSASHGSHTSSWDVARHGAGAAFQATARPAGSFSETLDPLSTFLVDRDVSWQRLDGEPRRLSMIHEPWRLAPAEGQVTHNSLWPEVLRGAPSLVHVAADMPFWA